MYKKLNGEREKDPLCTRLLRWLCCIDKVIYIRRGGPLLRAMHPRSQSKNELVVMGEDTDLLMVRITQKNFFVDYQQKKAKKTLLNVQESISEESSNSGDDCRPIHIYFTKFPLGVKFYSDELEQALPEKVYKYFSSRSNGGDYFVDPLCRNGAALIHFGSDMKYLRYIGLEISPEHLYQARHNTIMYRVPVEFLMANHLKYTKRPDLLFMKPIVDYTQEFDF